MDPSFWMAWNAGVVKNHCWIVTHFPIMLTDVLMITTLESSAKVSMIYTSMYCLTYISFEFTSYK